MFFTGPLVFDQSAPITYNIPVVVLVNDISELIFLTTNTTELLEVLSEVSFLQQYHQKHIF